MIRIFLKIFNKKEYNFLNKKEFFSLPYIYIKYNIFLYYNLFIF